MPVDNPADVEFRVANRRRRSDSAWIMVVFAIVAGCLLGYVFRPAIDSLVSKSPVDSGSGLDDVAKTQVSDSISQALTPLSSSLDEIRQSIKSLDNSESMADDDLAARDSSEDSNANPQAVNDVESLSEEIKALRLVLNDRVGHVEQLVKDGNEESRVKLEAFASKANKQLDLINDLEVSVNQLAAEVPRLQNTIRTMKPNYENPERPEKSSSESAKPKSVLETAGRSNVSMGSLVINNTSGRKASLIVNGQDQVIQPGSNSIQVPVGEVTIGHSETGTSWTLDESLWEWVGDQYVITRNWSY